ncbi:MAG: SurA N-terminal domain-containing protein [Chloroflexota bacterium]
MAKKRNQQEEIQRQSRKEVLLARRRHEQSRQIRLGIIGVSALIAVVILVAIVNEYLIRPRQAVAVVNGEEVSVRAWQERVRYQRAQIIISVEDLSETFGGDIGLVQQYMGQQLSWLVSDPQTLGQLVLDQMVDEVLIRQEAASRGITVSAEDVQTEIEHGFNFFDGGLPTPLPTATETVMPTPSLTPVPTAVITEVLPTETPFPTPTIGPTFTPQPTSTAVSLESFNEQYDTVQSRLRRLGVSEEVYRQVIEARLYREKLTEVLAAEGNLATEAEHASIFYISFGTEEAANESLAQIQASTFLTVWNTIRSTPVAPVEPAAEGEEAPPAPPVAAEAIWRTQEQLESIYGPDVAAAVFELELDTPSEVMVYEPEGAAARYYVVQVSGREVRPLPEGTLDTKKEELVTSWLESRRVGAEVFDRWQTRVPRTPAIDPKYLIPPTAEPATPTLPVPIDTPAAIETPSSP